MTDHNTEDNGESDAKNGKEWRSILSDKPSLKSAEGIVFLAVGVSLYVASAQAVEWVGLDPAWAFTAGIVFVVAVEPLRERLASRVADREELTEEI